MAGLAAKMEDPDDCTYMTVVIPGDLDPFDRHYRFSVHVDAELRLAGIGCSVGGGTLYWDDDDGNKEGGEPEIAYCILDVDAVDVDAVRALLQQHLPELGATAGTLIQYGPLEDRFDGTGWQNREPRSIED